KSKTLFLILRCIPAIIMLQTLWFKFTAHPDSVYIFSQLHVEPAGRILAGVAELIASILLFIPATSIPGALLGAAIMISAIFSHIFVLGVSIHEDGGRLFVLAIISFACCAFLLILKKTIRSK